MFPGSFKHHLNIKGIKGGRKRKKGVTSHLTEKRITPRNFKKKMLKWSERTEFKYVCVFYSSDSFQGFCELVGPK